jgi:hypothetical protein
LDEGFLDRRSSSVLSTKNMKVGEREEQKSTRENRSVERVKEQRKVFGVESISVPLFPIPYFNFFLLRPYFSDSGRDEAYSSCWNQILKKALQNQYSKKECSLNLL